jgi:hypothetical protein
MDTKVDDDVFIPVEATCSATNSIIVTQSLVSSSTSCISWYHDNTKIKKSYRAQMEINLLMDEKEKSVSDELVAKLNAFKFEE